MRRVILMGCFLLSIATYAQKYDRVRPGTPLKWGMTGSVEIMPGDLAYYYGSKDTATAHQRNFSEYNTVRGGNPNATRFASLKALCDHNGMVLRWTTVQQAGAADRYEVQQSTDGRHWSVAGVVPANRTETGEASYSFHNNKNGHNALYRVVATNSAGERVFSSVLESPCSNTAAIGITPNPVYSTTTIRIGSPADTKVNLTLLDGKGTAVLSRDEGLLRGINDLSLNLSGLPPGSYTLVIRWFNGKQEALNLIKQ